MRLIDADIAYASLSNYYHHRTEEQHKALKEALDRVITVDAEPTRHAHWITEIHPYNGAYSLKCSYCGEWGGLNNEEYNEKWRYCPNCGAKMDEEEQK